MNTVFLVAIIVAGVIISGAIKLGKSLDVEQPPQDGDVDSYDNEYDLGYEEDEIEGRYNYRSDLDRVESKTEPKEQTSWFEGTYKPSEPSEQTSSITDYNSILLNEYESTRLNSTYEPIRYDIQNDECNSSDETTDNEIEFDLRKAVIYSEILKNKYHNIN